MCDESNSNKSDISIPNHELVSEISNNNIEEVESHMGKFEPVNERERLRVQEEALQYLRDANISMKEKPEDFDIKERPIDTIDIR